VNEIIKLLTNSTYRPNLKPQLTAVPPDVTSEAIIKIIKNSLQTSKNVKKVIPENTRKVVEETLKTTNTPNANIAKLILNLIKNSTAQNGKLKPETAEQTLKVAGPPPTSISNSILKIITEALGPSKTLEIPPNRPVVTNQATADMIFKLIMNLFKTNGKMAVGPEPSPNFFAAKEFKQANRPKNGRKWYFGTQGDKTGWYVNTGAAVPFGPPGPPTPPPGPPGPPKPPGTRPNFVTLNLNALIKFRRENPGNANVNSEISKRIKKLMNNMRYSYSGSRRISPLVELLRKLPTNFKGRSQIISEIIEKIREITNLNKFSNFVRNLRGVENRNVRNALDVQRRRIEKRRSQERRPGESYNNYERRLRRITGGLGPSRYPGESDSNYNRRRREAENANAIRRALTRAEPPRPRNGGGYGPGGGAGGGYGPGGGAGGGYGPGGGAGGGYGPGGGAGGGYGPGGGPGGNGGAPPPPLPSPLRTAINNAGGAANAVQTVALVPGGAPEVAKAAEALNEMGGNVKLAINVKGVSPAAINAVKKLGGVSQTVKVLEGLNTLAQTPATRRLKAAKPRVRRAKKSPIRLTELNRVIAAVKKQKLISLTAHNVTRTHNIHPNDEKLKKYYRKVMKSYLLKKPFATIVKKAAKKRVA
jgi:hypothetical protein